MGGRVVKRVPMDFNWPMRAVWRGYVNPWRAATCTVCNGDGMSPAARELDRSFYDLDRRGDRWCDRLTQDEVDFLWSEKRLRWLGARHIDACPTVAEVNACRDAHDAINRWLLIRRRCEVTGVSTECAFCEGSGEWWPSDDVKAANEAWSPTEPPAGDGYQLWETTSEGSPVSPVFATDEELARWCATGATVFGRIGATAEEWLRMFRGEVLVHTDGRSGWHPPARA